MITLENDHLVFRFPDVHEDATCSIDLQRTLRIPDDGKHYPLPPGLGSFPLRHLDDFAARLPQDSLADAADHRFVNVYGLACATQWGFSVNLGHLSHVLVDHLAHPPYTLTPPKFSTRLPIVAGRIRFAVDSYAKYPTYPIFISISYIEKRGFYKLHPSIYSMDRLEGWISIL